MKKLYSNKLVILSLILPGLLLFIFAILAPICLSVYYGFTDYTGMGNFNMIGWENYKNLLHDEVFMVSLRNSLLLAIGFICIQHPIAMIVAAVLDKLGGKAESFFRCVYFIPNVISIAVIAKLWSFIYNPSFGLLNNIIKAFGGSGNINWLDEDKAIWSVLLVLIWHGFGWGMLIYYTGIKNIDPVLYEAAAIDGASQRQAFIHVTLPLMKPVIQVNVTMAVISALKQMETVYLLTQGGPGNSTQFAANYLYQQGFTAYKYGYGNAIGVIFIIICLITTVALNKVFEDRDEVKLRKLEQKNRKKVRRVA
ncbi:MAG: sugar ABC transporter permease [Eubacterium sp.]|nr:sugar ABC transporter permease [Eubacterium sp.]